MSTQRNREVILAAHPVGEPKESDFTFIDSAVPTPGPGQMLLRTIYLSLDPYMRGRMTGQRSYVAPFEIGKALQGGTVCEVVQSNLPKFKAGDFVQGMSGWQDYALSDGSGFRRIDPKLAPLSTALGVLGMPGLTAYSGFLTIGKPKPGETVVVSAAAGAVGSIVGQIARIKGCRVVGIAGGARKCAEVVREFGFDACVDYRSASFPDDLRAACPKGVDIYFENVGGAVFEAVLPLFNNFARMPVCGAISQYNATALPPGPNQVPALISAILVKRLAVQGFIVLDYVDQMPAFTSDVGKWIAEGKLKYREAVTEGLENAPRAFLGLFKGENFGKLLVRVSPDPTR